MAIYQFGDEVRTIAERIKQQVDVVITPEKISELASAALDMDYLFCKHSMFEPNQKTLGLVWLPSKVFKASATQRSSEYFNVNISYEVPNAVFRDAVQMSKVLSKAPAILHALPRPSNSIILTKPQEIKPHTLTQGLFELPFQWLFYHEVGHIIEGHGLLPQAKSLLVNEEGEFGLHDVAATNLVISEEAAWVSHALEISADYQGARLLIRRLAGKNNFISTLDIWFLVVGVTCLFYRFHDNRSEKFTQGAQGTHPDPTFRLRFFLANILDMVTDNAYAKIIPWAANTAILNDVINHALAFASSYWNNFNYSGTLIPQFIQEVNSVDDAKMKYVKTVQVKWKEMREQVLANYFKKVITSPMDFS